MKYISEHCEFNEILQIFSKITNEMQSKVQHLNTTGNRIAIVFDAFCEEEFRDRMNHFISESASTLTKCIDPNYLNYIDKLKTVALRSIMNLTNYPLSHENCASNNQLRLIGCVLFQDEVKEIVADKRLISNFTLELLDGTDKKCESLNKIQQCFIETFETCDDNEISNSFKLSSVIILKSLNCKDFE